MNLYRKVNVPQLETLQQKLLQIFPNDLLRNPRVDFNQAQNSFFEIKELVNFLISLGTNPANFLLGFHVVGPLNKSKIHIDWGLPDYSLNIPIKNCNNTITEWYSTDIDPVLVPERVEHGTHYHPHYSFEGVTCTPVDSVESNVPLIMHIKTPHRVINTNPNFRINLLIRHSNNEFMSNMLNGTP